MRSLIFLLMFWSQFVNSQAVTYAFEGVITNSSFSEVELQQGHTISGTYTIEVSTSLKSTEQMYLFDSNDIQLQFNEISIPSLNMLKGYLYFSSNPYYRTPYRQSEYRLTLGDSESHGSGSSQSEEFILKLIGDNHNFTSHNPIQDLDISNFIVSGSCGFEDCPNGVGVKKLTYRNQSGSMSVNLTTFNTEGNFPSESKQVPAMGGIGLLALGLSMLGLGAVRLRKE